MKLEEVFNDTVTDMQDMIISRFEADQISYDQAWEEIKKITPPAELRFWEMELISAEELKKDDDQIAREKVQRNIQMQGSRRVH